MALLWPDGGPASIERLTGIEKSRSIELSLLFLNGDHMKVTRLDGEVRGRGA